MTDMNHPISRPGASADARDHALAARVPAIREIRIHTPH